MSLFERVKKLKKDNRGISLLELIITIAIMSLVSVGIAAIIISSTRYYRKGSSEVEVQQDVQNITNILSNIIIDSEQARNYGSDATKTSPSTLFITASDGTKYTIAFMKADPSDTYGALYYYESHTNDYIEPTSGSGSVLVEHVINFSADTSLYVKPTYSVHIDLGIYNDSTDRSMETSFSVTSRNAEGGGTIIENIDGAVIVCDVMAVIEPNQTITIPYQVLTSGNAIGGINVSELSSSLSTLSASAPDASGKGTLTITCGSKEASTELKFTVSTKAKKGDKPYDTKTVTIYVRRANFINVDGSLTTGTNFMNNAVYTLSNALTLQNPDRFYAFSTDNDYISPKGIVYTVTYKKLSADDFEVIVNGVKQDISSEFIINPEDVITVKLKKDMPSGSSITFTGVAKHASGKSTDGATNYNKTGLVYYDAYGKVLKDSYSIVRSLFDPNTGTKRGSIALESSVQLDPMSNGPVWKTDLVRTAKEALPSLIIERDSCDPSSARYAELDTLIKYIDGLKDDSFYGDNYKMGYFYRIRENKEGAEWSQFRDMTSSFDHYYLDREVFRRIEPDKEYDLEVIAVFYDSNTSEILWPYYNDLLTYGFNHPAKNYGFSFNMIAEVVTGDYLSFAMNYPVGVASVDYVDCPSLNITAGKDAGSVSHPIILGGGKNALLQYNQMGWNGCDYNVYQNNIAFEVYYYDTSINQWKFINTATKTNAVVGPDGTKFNTVNDGIYLNSQSTTTDLTKIVNYRLLPIIKGFNIGYIIDSEGIYSKIVYHGDAKDYAMYTLDEDGNVVAGAIYLRAYGAPRLIELDANGGTCDVANITVAEGISISGLPTPTRSDYIFDGWFTSAVGGDLVTNGSSASGISKLYAHWSLLEYTVSLDSVEDITIYGVSYKYYKFTLTNTGSVAFSKISISCTEGISIRDEGWYQPTVNGTVVTINLGRWNTVYLQPGESIELSYYVSGGSLVIN